MLSAWTSAIPDYLQLNVIALLVEDNEVTAHTPQGELYKAGYTVAG